MQPSARGSCITSLQASPIKDSHCARRVVESCSGDETFWANLIQHREVLSFLCKSLKAKAQRDTSFAQCIVASRPDRCSLESEGVRARHPRSPASSQRSGKHLQPIISSGAAVFDVSTPVRRRCPARSATFEADILGTAGCTPVGRKRASPEHTALAATAPGAVARRSQRLGVAPAARRQLLELFSDDCSSDKDAAPAETPAKVSRRDRRYISAAKGAATASTSGSFLDPLPPDLAAEVVGFLPFSETVRLARCMPGARHVQALRTAWEPLVLERGECERLFRHLRQHDPVGALPARQLPVAPGLFEVRELRIALMDPDRVTVDDEQGAEGAMPGEPPCRLVLDPLEQAFRLVRCLPALWQFEVSNVEDHRLDYRFLQLRGSLLGGWPCVRCGTEGQGGEDGRRYTLSASRGPGATTALSVDIAAAAAMSAMRRPTEAPLLLEPAEEFTAADALFLQEHAAAFKGGDGFYVQHAPWRTFPGEAVRKRYNAILDAAPPRGSVAF